MSRRGAGVVAIVAVVLAGAALANRYGLLQAPRQNPRPATSSGAAPDFGLKDLSGREVHLSDFRGQIIVLNFWATWCAPCRVEIPWFNELHDRYRDKGVVFLGISLDEGGAKDVEAFLKEMPIHYRVLLGNDAVAEGYGGIFGIPTTILIGRDGKIAVKHLGLTDKDEIEDGIKRLL